MLTRNSCQMSMTRNWCHGYEGATWQELPACAFAVETIARKRGADPAGAGFADGQAAVVDIQLRNGQSARGCHGVCRMGPGM